MKLSKGPHQIYHDNKYQSKKDFEEEHPPKKESGITSPPPPYRPKGFFRTSDDEITPVPPRSTGSSPSSLESQGSSRQQKRAVSCFNCFNGNTLTVSGAALAWAVLILLIILAAIIVPIVITRKHTSIPVYSNTTATTTVIISQATTYTQTVGGSTIIVTATPTSSTTISNPTPTFVAPIIPGPPVGFVSYTWQDGDTQLFFQDPNDNTGAIYSTQTLSNISSTPVKIASDAMPGTTLTLDIATYDLDPNDTDLDATTYADDIEIWSITYVDKNSILQTLDKQIQYDTDQDISIEKQNILGGTGWTRGILGSYKYTASPTLYLQSFGYSTSSSGLDKYLSFTSPTTGIVQKIGYSYDLSTWTPTFTFPSLNTTTNIAILDTDVTSYSEYFWIITPVGAIEQYPLTTLSYYLPNSSPTLSYPGPAASNSSLAYLSLTTGSQYIFYQSPNGSIMQLNITTSTFYSTTTSTISSHGMVLGEAQLGTKLSVGSYFKYLSTATYSGYYDWWYSIYWQEGMEVVRHDFKAGGDNGYGVVGGGGGTGGGGGGSHTAYWGILPAAFVGILLLLCCCSN